MKKGGDSIKIEWLIFIFINFLNGKEKKMKRVTFSWYASTSTNVAGYKIKYGVEKGIYTMEKDVPGANVQTASIETDETKPVYAAIVAYNAFGGESIPSSEVTDNVNPSAPTGFRITKIETIAE